MRSKIVLAIALVVLVIVIGGSYMLYTIYFAPPWTVVQCPPYGCPSNPGLLILTAYKFPVGGPLTVALYIQGYAEDFIGAKFYVCNVVNGATQYPCASATPVGGDCSAVVSPGTTCQATVTVSETGLIAGSVCKFILVTSNVGAFYYSLEYGVGVGTITYASQTVQSQLYVTIRTSVSTEATTSTFGQGTPPSTASEKLVLSNYHWDMSSNSIWVSITNVGTIPINLAQSSVLINGVWASTPPSSCANLGPGWNCGFAFNPPSGNYVVGTTYTLSVQTPDGAVFSFPIVVGGSA
jgi:archaellum component FlaF (FlaF/FlaG flagellin family)